MHNTTTKLLLALAMAGLVRPCAAQGTVEDYRRAFSMGQKYSSAKVKNGWVNPVWTPGTHKFWYIREESEGRRYVTVDADRRKRKLLFDHEKLAEQLAKAEKREVKQGELYLNNLNTNAAQDSLWFNHAGQQWLYATATNELTNRGAVPAQGKQKHWMERDDELEWQPVTSPDGKWSAFLRDYNVWVREVATGKEKALTTDGVPGNYYSAYISWSPDSRKVATCKFRPTEKRYVYYVESSPSNQLQPKLHKQEYAKPGDELPFKVPCIMEVETGKQLVPSTALFAEQYWVLTPQWNKDSKAITFEFNQRGHQAYRVLEMSAETGDVRVVVDETSDKYVNYYRRFRHDLADGKRIIWMSERDNWNHLYLYDREKAKPIRQITKGEWYVRQVLHVDEEAGLIYFSANGMVPDEDPYLIRYYRIGLDGKGLTCLTPEMGMHSARFSHDMQYLVDTYSYTDRPPVAVLRRADNGEVVMPLETADASALMAEGWKAPEVFKAPGRDGKTEMWGLIVRPSNFDPNKKYPVIEYIYQGPGDQYVPKTFQPYNYFLTSIAELGFIVVTVDGMGTSFRSREFENVCWHNLKDAGLPDHMAWIKAAGEKYPYMDLDRVGIYGMSAGGQESTTALLHYPDFYKAAYSSCGCHDNRMDKIWWNEQWLGYPINESYREASNVENAHLLRRPLMLVVGEVDDNVDPASTMQVANALIKANKDFELVVIPGARHTMGERFGEHKRYDFFVRHLLGVTPPLWEEIEK